ncbi:hypothetical protein [Methanolobus psychrotolerans]|nr:hypothetical protein [Methanolobus psychrotolerans]
MKYGKSNVQENGQKKIDKETIKNIKAFGSVVVIKGGSLVDEE